MTTLKKHDLAHDDSGQDKSESNIILDRTILKKDKSEKGKPENAAILKRKQIMKTGNLKKDKFEKESFEK